MPRCAQLRLVRTAMRRGAIGLATMATCLVALSACTTAPREVVILADVLDDQIASLKTSHLAFVRLVYDDMRSDADDFLMDVWLPAFLAQTLAGETEASDEFLSEVERTWPLVSIDADELEISISGRELSESERNAITESLNNALFDLRGEFGDTMLAYTEGVMEQVEIRRRSLFDPIDEQERLVLRELESAYADVQAGQASLRGYLASVVELRAEQDELLNEMGILNERNALLRALEEGSAQIEDALASAETIEEAVAGINDELDRIREELGLD